MLTDFADVFGAIEACIDEANKKTKTSEVEQLRARIAELETALKDLREAVCDIDDREMFLDERRRWENCLAKADEVLKGGSGD